MRSDDRVEPCRTLIGIGIDYQLIEGEPDVATCRVDQAQASVEAFLAALIARWILLR